MSTPGPPPAAQATGSAQAPTAQAPTAQAPPPPSPPLGSPPRTQVALHRDAFVSCGPDAIWVGGDAGGTLVDSADAGPRADKDDAPGAPDFIGDASVFKKIFALPISRGRTTIAIHRVGRTLIVDTGDDAARPETRSPRSPSLAEWPEGPKPDSPLFVQTYAQVEAMLHSLGGRSVTATHWQNTVEQLLAVEQPVAPVEARRLGEDAPQLLLGEDEDQGEGEEEGVEETKEGVETGVEETKSGAAEAAPYLNPCASAFNPAFYPRNADPFHPRTADATPDAPTPDAATDAQAQETVAAATRKRADAAPPDAPKPADEALHLGDRAAKPAGETKLAAAEALARIVSASLAPPSGEASRPAFRLCTPPRDYAHVVAWQLRELKLVSGSDVVVCGKPGGGSPNTMTLRLASEATALGNASVRRLAVLDMWLDNVLVGVPKLALCLEKRGVVVGGRLVDTANIPSALPGTPLQKKAGGAPEAKAAEAVGDRRRSGRRAGRQTQCRIQLRIQLHPNKYRTNAEQIP
ncbi:hypothetical protein M885DRAFT_153765 [Pelagophyceae sp. CCMP2097]|nr:hypothetical protein M885DRAFT_153765 [Pelagophyceae sp. CCMP2097]